MTGAIEQALIEIAREVEALKRECGMDPESPTAIQNGRYMSISYKLRALAAVEAAKPAPEPEPVATVVDLGKVEFHSIVPIGTMLYARSEAAKPAPAGCSYCKGAAGCPICPSRIGASQPAPEAVEPLRAAITHDDLATLQHARMFITSRQVMHPVGVEQWDEMFTRLRAALSHSAPETAPEPRAQPQSVELTWFGYPHRGSASETAPVEADCNMNGVREFINAILLGQPIWPNDWGQDVAAAAFFITREREARAVPVEADGVSKDAERYRRWRAAYALDGTDHEPFLLAIADCWSEEQVDACIDAAMAPTEGPVKP